ncbi:MAG: hypothetical protein KatS3mg060_0420 [Dehalococcoidia bacterium]|nr:MAG: hypothetical protein KatS3mg060_0420 [Dehalococcoidia bacterium]
MAPRSILSGRTLHPVANLATAYHRITSPAATLPTGQDAVHCIATSPPPSLPVTSASNGDSGHADSAEPLVPTHLLADLPPGLQPSGDTRYRHIRRQGHRARRPAPLTPPSPAGQPDRDTGRPLRDALLLAEHKAVPAPASTTRAIPPRDAADSTRPMDACHRMPVPTPADTSGVTGRRIAAAREAASAHGAARRRSQRPREAQRR